MGNFDWCHRKTRRWRVSKMSSIHRYHFFQFSKYVYTYQKTEYII